MSESATVQQEKATATQGNATPGQKDAGHSPGRLETWPTTQAGGGRDGKGRFGIGNPGGPGNPYARRVAELRRALLEAVSAADIAGIIAALVAKAKEGNVQAAKVVLAYTLGKPEGVADPDRVDAHEWGLQQETAGMMGGLGAVASAPPAEVALNTARVLRPIVGGMMRGKLADVFLHPKKYELPGLKMEGEFKAPSANGLLEILGMAGASEAACPTSQAAGAEEEWLKRLGLGAPSANGKKGNVDRATRK